MTATGGAFSIQEFCKAHGISEALYYKMQNAGTGPRVMEVGTRRLISQEAAADWRRSREGPPPPPPSGGDLERRK
jgi:hypothetical protein